MVINENDSEMLHLFAVLLDTQHRFMKYGAKSVEEYREIADNPLLAPLVYDTATLDEDNAYTVFKGYGATGEYHKDVCIRFFPNKRQALQEIEFAVPVARTETCMHCRPAPNADCDTCDFVSGYHVLHLAPDGGITEEFEATDQSCCGVCEDHCECRECGTIGETAEWQAIKECRDSGAHNRCNCECGEEHCFVECRPVNDEDCELNENGRCHCPHNRCCGCDCECEPDEED